MQITNTVLGSNGKFFPLIYFLVISIFTSGIILLWAGVYGKYLLVERAGVIGAACFLIYYCAIGIQAIDISKRTVKSISTEGNIFHCTTFGRIEIDCLKSSISKANDNELSSRAIRFMFPENLQHYSIFSGKKTYFISGSMKNIESLLNE
jgi:hypothetical protein